MQSSPLVSVIISTQNRSQTLQRAIDSVFAQKYTNIEIIVVNDASTDETAEIISRYAKRKTGNRNFVAISNKINRGLAASLNKAISISKGKYIARLDDDDTWIDSKKLEKQINILERDQSVALLGSGYVDDNNIKTINPLTDQAIRQQMLFRCPFCHSTVVIRKNVLSTIEPYDESLAYAEDWELWLRIGKRYKLSNIADITARKNFSANTLSSKYFVEQLPIIKKILEPYKSIYNHGRLSTFYHLSVRYFFILIATNSLPHRIAHRIYSFIFLKLEKGKRRDGKSFLGFN